MSIQIKYIVHLHNLNGTFFVHLQKTVDFCIILIYNCNKEAKMKKAITIKDIAEQLNLSRNIVAKALNGQYVPESTRERVLKKAAEMGYKSLGDREKAGKTRHRFILISGKPLNNMNYFVPLIRAVENSCFEKNIELLQYVYNKSRTPFKGVADYVNELDVNGIIAIECFDKSFIDKLEGLGKPICFIDFTASLFNPNGNYDIICSNDRHSTFTLVNYLINKHNLKRITFVGDRLHCMSFRERYLGMLNAIIRLCGGHSRNEDILFGDESFNYGDVNAVKTKILQLKYRPQLFVCCNDFVARIVCTALKELNIRIPDDAFVTGFDNVAESRSAHPVITTFSVDREFMGRQTIYTLLNRIENPDCPTRIINIGTTLVQGETTR